MIPKLEPQLENLIARMLSNANYEKPYKQQSLNQYIPKEEHKRNWTEYESNCRREKLMFLKILKYAVSYLNLKTNYKGNGRPNATTDDIILSICIRLYSNYSSWRCESELEICRSMGYLENIYRRSTLNKYQQSPEVTIKLRELFMLIARPLAPIELHFSADATGIGHAYGNKRWVEVREEPQRWKEYQKLHIISGSKSNIIVSARVTQGNRNDSPMLPEMLDDIKGHFNIREFSADAGYLSKKNVKAISQAGALPFIKPKRNVSIPSKGLTSPWGNMLRLWKENQDLFSQYYNKRQNVEATFSMIKRKWGGFCRSKNHTSQENEILAKIVCHNAVILARAMVDFNLDVKFMDTL